MELTAGLVSNIALAAGAATLVGVLGYFALRLGNYARYETDAGAATLSALKWREFANLLVHLFRKRGFEPMEKDPRSRGGGFDLLFVRGAARYLLQCKHGASYRVSVADVADLLVVMRTQGAEGGIIVTTGRVDPAAQEAVYAKNLDLLDGKELWRELHVFLPRTVLDEAQERAGRTRVGLIRRVAVLGLLTGILAFIGAMLIAPPLPETPAKPVAALMPAPSSEPAAEPVPAPMPEPEPAYEPPPPVPAPAAATPSSGPVPVATASRPVPVAAPKLSEAQLAGHRATAAERVRAVPGVATAEWSTKSTILVAMESGDAERRDRIVAEICAALEDFEEMHWTRLQMHEFNATTESDARVRWHQCR